MYSIFEMLMFLMFVNSMISIAIKLEVSTFKREVYYNFQVKPSN